MVKILIAADMEGITGVTSWDQVNPSHPEYARFRKLMTGDVNAAIRGAFEAGADEVVVADGHWSGSNLLVEEIDPRVKLNSGSPAPFSMVQGIDNSINGALFIGYHARAGSQNAILDHTWSSSSIANLWLNDLLVGETGLNAAVCGHFNAPVLMISGDQTVCQEANDLLGALEIAVVKIATGRFAATCLPPQVTHKLIQEASARAVGKLAASAAKLSGEAAKLLPQPLRLPAPVQTGIEFFNSDMADRAALLPGARRTDGRKTELVSADMPSAYRSFRSAVSLARS